MKQVISIFLFASLLCSVNAFAKKKKKKDKQNIEEVKTLTETKVVEQAPPPVDELPKLTEAVPRPATKPGPEGIDMPACKPGTLMKDYRIIKSDRTDFYTKDLPSDKYTFLVIFNPTCDHCQRQAMKYMEAQKKELSNTSVVYVCSQMLIDMLPEFEQKIGYTPRNNFIIGVDTYDFMNELFEYRYMPQTIVYGKDKKVIKVFYKETEIKELLEVMK